MEAELEEVGVEVLGGGGGGGVPGGCLEEGEEVVGLGHGAAQCGRLPTFCTLECGLFCSTCYYYCCRCLFGLGCFHKCRRRRERK